MTKESITEVIEKREAWSKAKLIGQKPPLRPKDIWAIRIHIQNAHAVRDLAMFNFIESKLRGCDLISQVLLRGCAWRKMFPCEAVDALAFTQDGGCSIPREAFREVGVCSSYAMDQTELGSGSRPRARRAKNRNS